MANLGTLDRTPRFGLNSVATAIAQNAVKNGNEWDKLAALIGGYVGDRMGQHKRKKQDAKLDDIINQAKATPTEQGQIANGSILSGTPGTISEQDYKAIMGEPITTSAGENGIGEPGVIDEANSVLGKPVISADTLVGKPANGEKGYNPNYNMDYIREQARKQGISSGVLADREAAIQRDIAQTANAYYLPQIQSKIYGTAEKPATTDSILEGMSMLNELSKYSPETAKAYQTLAVNGLQGNRQFTQAKELAQMKADLQAQAEDRRLANNIRYRVATAGLGRGGGGGRGSGGGGGGGGRTRKSAGYDPTKVANAGKRIQEIEAYINENGQESLTPALRQEYNAHRRYLAEVYGEDGNAPQTGTNGTGEGQGQQPTTGDKLRSLINNIDYATWEGDDIEGGKDYNFVDGTQAAVDIMRKAGATDDQIFKAMDATLAQKEKAGELPAGYREKFAHSMDRKTDRELTEEALKKKEEEALELDKQLHPEKYDIEPLAGVKHFFDAIANGKPL